MVRQIVSQNIWLTSKTTKVVWKEKMAYLHTSPCIPVDKQRHVYSLGVTRNDCLHCLCCLYSIVLAGSHYIFSQPLLRWAWLFGRLENYLYVVAYPLGVMVFHMAIISHT